MKSVDALMKQMESSSGPLSKLLGEDSPKTQSALAAVVPTLMAGLAGNAESPEGVRRLNAAVEEADDDPGARLADMLKEGAPPQDSLGLLGGLLGGGGDVGSKLTATLARFLGVKEDSLSKLIAMAVPLVLGYFKKQKKEQALDDAGFGRLLAGQKSELAGAIPDGLGKRLAGNSGLGPLGSMAQGLFGPAGDAGQAAPPRPVTEPAKSPMLSKVVPIVVLVAVAFLLWKLVSGGRDERTPIPVPPTAGSTTEAGQLLVVDTLDALAGVNDAASARAALPQLESISGRIGTLEDGFGELDAEARRRVSAELGASLGELRSRAGGVLAIPGVSEVLAPQLEPILAKLEDLADR